MKRIVFIVLLQFSAYFGFAQEKIGGDNHHVGDEYGNIVPNAIVHLAKSIWLHFPKADKVHYNYKGRLIANENDVELNLLVPLDSLSASLKDSIEATLSHEQANATMASVTREPGPNGDSMTYSLVWLHGRRTRFSPLEGSAKGENMISSPQPPRGMEGQDESTGDSLSRNNSTVLVNYYEAHRHASFEFKFSNLRAILGAGEPQQEVTGLDELLDGLKRQYKTKKKKVILLANDNRSTGVGYEYALDCDAEKVYDDIRSYVGHEYLMKHTPLFSFNYFYDTDMMTIRMFKQVNEQDGGTTQKKRQDREIQICSRNGKLLIIDITNQNDRNTPCSIFSWWDALMEGPDNHYHHPGKITKQGNSTTLQIRDEVYRMKRKNRFSSTYIFEQGL